MRLGEPRAGLADLTKGHPTEIFGHQREFAQHYVLCRTYATAKIRYRQADKACTADVRDDEYLVTLAPPAWPDPANKAS